jgi:hypothetical protein
MNVSWLICLGLVSGTGAGLLAGLIGIGGGIVIVPVMYYGLLGGRRLGRPGGAYRDCHLPRRDPAGRAGLLD